MSNPKETLMSLPQRLAAIGIETLRASSLWQNPAWPEGLGYPDYLNGVLSVSFDGTADEILDRLLGLEEKMGRVRSQKNAPRPLDLDVLDFGGELLMTDRLTLPHPRMESRAFVILPLAEIAPDWQHPILHKRAMEILASIPLRDMNKMRFAGRLEV